MNIAESLTGTATRQPANIALRLDDVSVSYADLDRGSGMAAAALRERGVAAGDRVGIMLPNVPQFAIWYYAALRLGAIVVPMNPLLKSREIAYYLSDAGASVLVAWHETLDAAEAGARNDRVPVLAVHPRYGTGSEAAGSVVTSVEDRANDDTAVILYTSGTTGEPKGAELTHGNLGSNVAVTTQTLLALSPDDVVFGGLPLFHVFGQTCGLNSIVSVGATLTLMPRFDAARALEILARDRVTVMEGVPTMYVGMLNQLGNSDADLPHLRVCLSGGSPFPIHVMARLERALDCPILEGYGLSETSPAASFNHPGQLRSPGSVGVAVRDVQLRIDAEPGEVGEILVHGPNVMKGYWRRPLETAAALVDGWLHTGDLGRIDEAGNLFVVDRTKDMIIRSGYNVYPREIEEVLYEHPAVAEAAVIGIPHPELGEEVGAAVTMRPGQVATEDDLREFVRERVAAYKYPRHIWVLEALPKGPTGKILKREIRRDVSDEGRISRTNPRESHD